MRVLIDTNVFLDVLLNRREWAEDSARILNHLEKTPGSGWIAWHTLSNLYYIGRKMTGEARTRSSLQRILAGFELCPVHSHLAVSALDWPVGDYEDALQIAAGIGAEVNWIVTRNGPGFKGSPIPILSPKAAVERFGLE
jgi:predicted nucleic acid-binding protein